MQFVLLWNKILTIASICGPKSPNSKDLSAGLFGNQTGLYRVAFATGAHSMSGAAWPEVDRGSESYQFITSVTIRTIELSCDWAVFRLPEEEHDPDFGVILSQLVSTLTQHTGYLVVSGCLELHWHCTRSPGLEWNDAMALSDEDRYPRHKVRLNHG